MARNTKYSRSGEHKIITPLCRYPPIRPAIAEWQRSMFVFFRPFREKRYIIWKQQRSERKKYIKSFEKMLRKWHTIITLDEFFKKPKNMVEKMEELVYNTGTLEKEGSKAFRIKQRARVGGRGRVGYKQRI